MILSGSTGSPDLNEAAMAACNSDAIGRKTEVDVITLTTAHGPNLNKENESQKRDMITRLCQESIETLGRRQTFRQP